MLNEEIFTRHVSYLCAGYQVENLGHITNNSELTLFSRLTRSCNPSIACSLSCSSISWEEAEE